MAKHPILFTDESVIKIMTCAKCGTITIEVKCPKCGSQERLKTQTRRIIKPQPVVFDRAGQPDYANLTDPKKKWQVGDTLWVRETTRLGTTWPPRASVEYITDGAKIPKTLSERDWERFGKRKYPQRHLNKIPNIHMFKSCARIFLEITNIRVEKVQDISREDTEAEGVIIRNIGETYWRAFHNLWDSINAKRGYGWDKNPFVWVVEFKINS